MKEQFATEANTSVAGSPHAGPHILPTRTAMWVWIWLLILTAVTVTVTEFDLGSFHVFVAISVATVKAALVIFWFMHMKYEGAVIRWMLFVVFVILSIFISFIFFDVLYR